jgi:hypothetical protein
LGNQSFESDLLWTLLKCFAEVITPERRLRVPEAAYGLTDDLLRLKISVLKRAVWPLSTGVGLMQWSEKQKGVVRNLIPAAVVTAAGLCGVMLLLPMSLLPEGRGGRARLLGAQVDAAGGARAHDLDHNDPPESPR